MKKIISIFTAMMLLMSVAACGNAKDDTASGKENNAAQATVENNEVDETAEEKPETVTITALNANKEESQIEVPYDPQRIAILDMAALDILDNLGLGDRIVGSATTTLDYLQDYVNNEEITNLGTIKEADLEAVMECEPDIIFIGGRLSASYDALSEIAPVVYLETDSELGVVGSVSKNAVAIASIFGLEELVAEKISGFEARIETLSEFAEGKNVVVGMVTSGSFNVLGDDGRCSIIGREMGFNNLGNDVVAEESESSEGRGNGEGRGNSEDQSNSGTATHGNEASFEVIVKLAPEYIFVMDRDAAIGTDGAQLAQEIMENELVMGTDAYKNGNIVYLEHPAVWYTAEGGITALDVMLSDLESALLP